MTITQSSQAPLVVIGGATGNQGGSVLRYLKDSDKEYRIRALTRDSTKPKAKALANLGAEVISIDLKPENQDKIEKAYAGADVVFVSVTEPNAPIYPLTDIHGQAVTNFWEHVDKQREINEGKAMIDAGVAAGVKLFIFSSLPSPENKSKGAISNVHHFEGKARIEEYGRTKSSPTFQFVAVQAGFYDSNIIGQQLVRKEGDGTWVYRTPISADTLVPSIDIDEYGLWVRAIIEHKEVREDGRAVPADAEDISLRDMITAITKATGTPIKIVDNMPYDEFVKTFPEGTPPHVIEDLGVDMWKFHAKDGYFLGVDTKWPLKYLAHKPSTFAEWLKKADLSEYTK
ncbi:hypothetical protein QFC22_000649 [Naganishia vaughanmartiniae]|uniref:Uncharacterized protein n=1 Tax=Naganishia vaughanmartiniae TaxID=1424756 RepID=A0ACC2XQN3_9TREE|nr:hypothetical protein QFC22_000649 [Naganishia vaughanmartiniae]